MISQKYKQNQVKLKKILALAKKVRIIQAKSEPVFDKIESVLNDVYPELDGHMSGTAADWTCDVISCDNDTEVKKVLKRLHDYIFQK